MMLNDITAEAGAHKKRKRVGRGESSGMGKTCGRGNKGCQSRSGGGTRPTHEGGQMPIFRRLPKRGFSNVNFARTWQVVNLDRLERAFDSGTQIDVETLKQRRLISGARPIVKILAKGTLSKKLSVAAHAFSPKAREAIEQAGGTVTVITLADPAEQARAKRNSKKKTRAKTAPPKAEKPVEVAPAAAPPAEPEAPQAEPEKPAEQGGAE